MDKRTILMN